MIVCAFAHNFALRVWWDAFRGTGSMWVCLGLCMSGVFCLSMVVQFVYEGPALLPSMSKRRVSREVVVFMATVSALRSVLSSLLCGSLPAKDCV